MHPAALVSRIRPVRGRKACPVAARLSPGIALAVALTAALAPAPGAAQQVQTRTIVTSRASGWLGIRLDGFAVPPETPGAVDGVRLIVTDLYRGGPAERGGLRRGDVLVGVNGAAADFALFQSLASRLLPGHPLALTVLRDGREVDVALRASQAPDQGAMMPRETQVVQVRLDSVRHQFEQRLSQVRARLEREGTRGVLTAVPTVRLTSTDGDSVTTVVMIARADGSIVRLRSVADAGQGVSGFSYDTPPDSVRVRLFTGGRPEVQAGPTRAPVPEGGTADARHAWRPLTPYLVGANRVAGAELRPLDERLGVYFGAERGLLVTDVAEGTPAYASGLRAGDVLRFVDGREVTSVGQARTMLAGARGPVELRVLRRGRTHELVLPR